MLVVDLDGEPLAPLRALEEILLRLGTWEDDDRRDPSTGTEPLRLPAPLADRAALAAVQRLLTAPAPTQSREPGRGRLLAPDGRMFHRSPQRSKTSDQFDNYPSGVGLRKSDQIVLRLNHGKVRRAQGALLL